MEPNSHIGFSDPKICVFFMSSGLLKIEQTQVLPWLKQNLAHFPLYYYLSKTMA